MNIPFCVCDGNECPIHNKSFNDYMRLISAAPELLSGLKDLFQMMDEQILVRNTENDHKPEWAGLIMGVVTRLKSAQDAISKAEGRSE